MGSELTATYRLVYFQPDPEDGERVCVALLFNAQRDVELLYDPEFPKLRCLAPHLDPSLVRVYLDDMVASAKGRPSEADLLIKRHAPQIVTSEARRSAWPLSESARSYLMRRFLAKERPEARLDSKGAAAEERVDPVKVRIRDLVLKVAKEQIEDVREDATSQWVLGRSLPYIAPVAVALRTPSILVLIDGVDLSASTTKGALSRVNKVAHTFWQYGRVRQMGVDKAPPHRIGIVLNGSVDSGTSYRDAHDFALHQFRNEADLAVDASSIDDVKRLEAALKR
jgi:hypothetical protein